MLLFLCFCSGTKTPLLLCIRAEGFKQVFLFVFLVFEFVIYGTIAVMSAFRYFSPFDSFYDLAAFLFFVGAFCIFTFTYVVVKLGKARRKVFKFEKVKVDKIEQTKPRRVCEECCL